MKRSLIKVAAVATILALGGLGLAYDALAWGRFDGRHFGHGAWFTGKSMTMADEYLQVALRRRCR